MSLLNEGGEISEMLKNLRRIIMRITGQGLVGTALINQIIIPMYHGDSSLVLVAAHIFSWVGTMMSIPWTKRWKPKVIIKNYNSELSSTVDSILTSPQNTKQNLIGSHMPEKFSLPLWTLGKVELVTHSVYLFIFFAMFLSFPFLKNVCPFIILVWFYDMLMYSGCMYECNFIKHM